MTIAETFLHIRAVQKNIKMIIHLLQGKQVLHDHTWYEDADERGLQEGDPKWQKAHYAKNTHHPEHFHNDISKMDLIDIIEMVCDWVGEGAKVEKNIQKYGIDEQLAAIIVNTLKYFK